MRPATRLGPHHTKVERLLVAGGCAVHFASQTAPVHRRDGEPGVSSHGHRIPRIAQVDSRWTLYRPKMRSRASRRDFVLVNEASEAVTSAKSLARRERVPG